MSETTTVRVQRATRDRLTQLGRQLDVSSADEVVTRALDLLERDLFWREWQRAHGSTSPEERDEDAAQMAPWDRAGAQDWVADVDR